MNILKEQSGELVSLHVSMVLSSLYIRIIQKFMLDRSIVRGTQGKIPQNEGM